MTETKVDSDSIALRAPPRPVTRLNRRTIAIVVGAVAATVLGATIWSLQWRKGLGRDSPTELHNVDRIAKAEGLEQLPPDYSKLLPAAPAPPVLGNPLPGDLGGPILQAERAAGDSTNTLSSSAKSTSPSDDAVRAERISREREADEAAKAPLFFRGSKSRSEPAIEPRVQTSNSTVQLPATSMSGTANNVSNSAQDQKERFLSAPTETNTRSAHMLQLPDSPYQIAAGTVIPAALITGINSDLPGQVLATVTQPVYDTATGHHLLIPQGSRLIGQYDSHIVGGQRRVLLVWNRLVMPDTSSVLLDRLPGVDAGGYAGLKDAVDRHWDQILLGAALSTLIGVTAELAAPERDNQTRVIVATRESAQDSINQVGQELTRRNLNVQPTLTIRPGFPVQIIVNKDVVLRPYQPLFFQRSAQ